MKLALGTVQFGVDYGVANTYGQTSFDEARNILVYAKEVGIHVLDTASMYGQSESVLGRIGVKNWNIITKIPPLISEVANLELWVVNQVKTSMVRLGVDVLAGVLLHRPEDLLNDRSGGYLRGLDRLRCDGMVTNIGYSIYSPEILDSLTKVFWPDIVQSPFNVFDQRIRTSGWLERLAGRGTEVHSRSVFLQGLLLMPPEARPKYFAPWASLFAKWDEKTIFAGMSPLEVALSFALQEEQIDRVVVGVDNRAQLEVIARIKQPSSVDELRDLVCNDPQLIDPFRWRLP